MARSVSMNGSFLTGIKGKLAKWNLSRKIAGGFTSAGKAEVNPVFVKFRDKNEIKRGAFSSKKANHFEVAFISVSVVPASLRIVNLFLAKGEAYHFMRRLTQLSL